ncbi:oxidoreductase, partial [Streptomyces scabiei]
RTDQYGGSLENRGRFWREVIEDVRTAVGDDCAIAVRLMLHGRDGWPSIETDDMLEWIRSADHLVDLFDVTVGSWPE